MSKEATIQIETELLVKFAEFTKLILGEIRSLKNKEAYYIQKQASEELQEEKYYEAVSKVANALYNSDLDFITGDFDRRKFIKRAMEDHTYVARTLEKVCNAADVGSIGKPASIKVAKNNAYNDPVYAKAFGYNPTEDLLIDSF
jgi:hypothetical protein